MRDFGDDAEAIDGDDDFFDGVDDFSDDDGVPNPIKQRLVAVLGTGLDGNLPSHFTAHQHDTDDRRQGNQQQGE